MEEFKRAVVYVRYSTNNQDDNYSVAIQLERTKLLCASKGWTVVEEFIDPAYSGSNMERPALQEMLSRTNEFDIVVVYRLDRLSRSQKDTMTLIQDHFLKNKVDFVSVSETLDTTTPFGLAMIGILAVFAELERATISERMQAGVRKRVQEGYRIIGGNYVPIGYKKAKDDEGNNILVTNEELSREIRRIYDVYEQTHSITKIQETLKKEGFKTRTYNRLLLILQNRLYIGEVKYNDEYFKGVHEAIITEEQFARVQVIMDNRPKGSNIGKSLESLFASFVQCGCCKEKYSAWSYKVKKKKGHPYQGNQYIRKYVCNARRYPKRFPERTEKCKNQIVKNDSLESLFIKRLDAFLKEKKNSVASPKKQTNYGLMIKKVDEKIMRLLELYEEGEIDKAKLNERIEQRNKEKENILKQQMLDSRNETSLIEINEIQECVTRFLNMEFIEKRALVEKVLKRIIVEPENIIFEWDF